MLESNPQETVDSSSDTRSALRTLPGLVELLEGQGVALTRTFANIGAGDCNAPDPINALLMSNAGSGFLGLAVEMNLSSLQGCAAVAAQGTNVIIRPVNIAVEQHTVGEHLATHMSDMFSQSTQ